MLNGIVEKVIIHERDVFEAEHHQRIDIYYNFMCILGDGQHTFGDRRWRENIRWSIAVQQHIESEIAAP